ncbi:MAG: alanine racemase [Treponema sp.]|jgi:alanine racemase|nr:alanine racemase [Treponema sp.]
MTKAIIHLDRFMSNFYAVKARIGECRICVPVKADAYGHGVNQIAKTSLEAGAYCLGAATVSEGIDLRKAGITAPILLFSQPHYKEIPEIIDSGLIPFVSDESFASLLNREAESRKVKLLVHIKIDTGMGRIGCPVETALYLARYIVSCPGLELAGTATHFAVADSADEWDIFYTQMQLSRFKEAVEQIKSAGINPGIVHAANSGAVILHPDTWLDMVRPGILLYGYKTVNEDDTPLLHRETLSGYEPVQAQPVMELKTIVSLVKKIKKGDSVSYGRTWTALQDTFIAVLPLGYADGFPRLASNQWQVTINNKTYPLIGRICMDQCIVNLGPETDVQRWEEATVIGGFCDAALLAEAVGTIPYEITCNIGNRVIREYRG